MVERIKKLGCIKAQLDFIEWRANAAKKAVDDAQKDTSKDIKALRMRLEDLAGDVVALLDDFDGFFKE